MNRIKFFFLAVLCFLFTLTTSACSLYSNTNLFTDIQVPASPLDAELASDIQNTVPEPEETLEEELAELDKLGDWKKESAVSQTMQVTQTKDSTQKPGKTEKKEVVTYDFPITINKQVQMYLNLFQTKHRKYYSRWLARSSKYVPYIQEELKKAGLPLDLAYLAMIESGYNPSAYSHAHAAGLWQFIKGTGRNYGLQINSWVDERRNPEKATKSAIAYLSNLYNEFDDWYLAVAAYNAGEGKIGRAIKRYKTHDFWELAQYKYLKLETKRYVPKLIAAIIISKDPEKYGFTNVKYQKPVLYDEYAVPPLTNISAIALACNASVKTLEQLNNELRKNVTPPGSSKYVLRIPQGTKQILTQNLPRVHPVVATAYKTHVIKRGENLTSICRKYKLNKTTLLKANNIRTGKLVVGKHLRIPHRTTKYVLLKEGESPRSRFASATTGGKLILHTIRNGESLSKIAKNYRVTPEIIMQWNGLHSVHKIRAGNQLALYIDDNPQIQVSSHTSKSVNKPFILADNKKQKPSSRSTPDIYTYYRVKNGDSLWTIARKFKVSTFNLKRWNKLRTNMIRPGKQLIIKKG